MTITFSTYDELKVKLNEEAQGVATIWMWQLRESHGAERLGVNVVNNIAAELESIGIGHHPESLQANQYARVRVFLKKSAVGRVLNAALELNEDQDVVLRRLTNEKADEVLKKVRELVCD